MSNWARNKEKAKYFNTAPTKTDQAGADATNINIIVGQQLTTGYAPGAPKPPMYEDFTQFPEDLREALEKSREVRRIRDRLPPQLKERTIEELVTLTPNDLTNILKPPVTPPEQQKDEPKT